MQGHTMMQYGGGGSYDQRQAQMMHPPSQQFRSHRDLQSQSNSSTYLHEQFSNQQMPLSDRPQPLFPYSHPPQQHPQFYHGFQETLDPI